MKILLNALLPSYCKNVLLESNSTIALERYIHVIEGLLRGLILNWHILIGISLPSALATLFQLLLIGSE